MLPDKAIILQYGGLIVAKLKMKNTGGSADANVRVVK